MIHFKRISSSFCVAFDHESLLVVRILVGSSHVIDLKKEMVATGGGGWRFLSFVFDKFLPNKHQLGYVLIVIVVIG